MKKALLFGASGLTGSCLLRELLDNPAYCHVTIIVRKRLEITHPKLKMLIGDYFSLPDLSKFIETDAVFIALGTTTQKTLNRQEYYLADHDYPVLAAKIGLERGAKSVFLVSAVSSDPGSSVFYVRTKGETERDITALGFEYIHIFRPSLLLGNRQENRPFEKMLIGIWPYFNFILIGNKFSRYRGIKVDELARAMNLAAGKEMTRLNFYYWKEMKELIRNYFV